MTYTIQLEHNTKIVKYVHKGTLDKSDIGEAWHKFLVIPEFTSKEFNLLSNYSEAKFDLCLEDIDLVCGFLGELEHILRGKKQAIVINDPLSTALTMLFENKIYEQIGFNVGVFSTEEVAREWLAN